MKRRWIVGIRGCSMLTVPDAPGEDLQKCFSDTLSQLGERVDGEPVYALVPTEAVVRALGSLSFSPPAHLVVPRESAAEGTPAGGIAAQSLSRVASINVQPGRGDTGEDWEDCGAWLDSITEIDLIIIEGSATAGDKAGNGDKRPRVIFSLSSGEALFDGFGPDGSLESDVDFNEVAKDVFGKKPMPDRLLAIKDVASVVSGKCAPRFRFLETGSLFLNISPSIILAMGAFGLATTPRAIWKFAAALLATLAALGLKKVRSRRCWLSSRALAEICRSIQHSGDILDPLFPPAANHLTKFASLSRSLAINLVETAPEESAPVLAIRDRYLAKRLGGEHGQINYYSGQAERAQRRRKRVKAIFQIATVLALASTLFALLSLMGFLPGTECFNEKWVSGFATFAFPALAAASIGYLGLSETTRRADYYEEMVRMLRKQEAILTTLKSESSIMEAIRKTESILLEEFAGWLRRRVY